MLSYSACQIYHVKFKSDSNPNKQILKELFHSFLPEFIEAAGRILAQPDSRPEFPGIRIGYASDFYDFPENLPYILSHLVIDIDQGSYFRIKSFRDPVPETFME